VLILEAQCDFFKDEVAQRNGKFLSYFQLCNFLHFDLIKQFQNSVSCRNFKFSKVVGFKHFALSNRAWLYMLHIYN
jgi:hypothetical protein